MRTQYISLSKLPYIIALAVTLISFSCKTSNSTARSGLSDLEVKSMIDNRTLSIEFEYAYPLGSNALNQISNSGLLGPGNSASQINLIGNSNYLRISGDSIFAELPFYGERRMGGNYNNRDVGVRINGEMRNIKENFNEKKGQHTIDFRAEGINEDYDGYLMVFSNGTVHLNLTGTNRTPIQYKGKLLKTKVKEDQQL